MYSMPFFPNDLPTVRCRVAPPLTCVTYRRLISIGNLWRGFSTGKVKKGVLESGGEVVGLDRLKEPANGGDAEPRGAAEGGDSNHRKHSRLGAG